MAVVLTSWLARQLSRHRELFLHTVSPDRHHLADAINQLLVIGFYVVNIGWALLCLRANEIHVENPTGAIALLTTRLGTLLLLLYVFHRVRRGAESTKLAA